MSCAVFTLCVCYCFSCGCFAPDEPDIVAEVETVTVTEEVPKPDEGRQAVYLVPDGPPPAFPPGYQQPMQQ